MEQQTTDHDLLIELRTEMRSVKDTLKTLNDNISVKTDDALKKVDCLEKEKMDKAIAHQVFEEAKTVTDKLDARLCLVERITYVGLGILTVLEFVLNYFKK